MEREELLRSKEYWLIHIQNKVFNLLSKYKEDKKLNQSQLAKEMGVTKGYVSQIMSGDYDHKVSKLVDLALLCNKAPIINFVDIETHIKNDNEGINSISDSIPGTHYHFWVSNEYESLSVLTLNEKIGQNLLKKFQSVKEIKNINQEISNPDFEYSNYSGIAWQKK